MLVSAGVSLIIAFSLWIIVRDDPSERGYTSFAPPSNTTTHSPASFLTGLLKVFYYKNAWLLSIVPAGIVGPVLAFSGLWGVPFLTTHYGLTPAKSAALTSTLLVAWAVGGPVLGVLSDRISRRKPIYVTGCFAICAGWSLVLFMPDLPLWVLAFLLSMVGFASGAMILGFAFVKESVPPSLAGTVSGVCNMGVMIGPMVLQPAMGHVLDSKWNGLLENGIRTYHLGAYQSAFTLMIVWSVISAILICFTTETRCRQKVLD
jgi:MFS family permease